MRLLEINWQLYMSHLTFLSVVNPHDSSYSRVEKVDPTCLWPLHSALKSCTCEPVLTQLWAYLSRASGVNRHAVLLRTTGCQQASCNRRERSRVGLFLLPLRSSLIPTQVCFHSHVQMVLFHSVTVNYCCWKRWIRKWVIALEEMNPTLCQSASACSLCCVPQRESLSHILKASVTHQSLQGVSFSCSCNLCGQIMLLGDLFA